MTIYLSKLFEKKMKAFGELDNMTNTLRFVINQLVVYSEILQNVQKVKENYSAVNTILFDTFMKYISCKYGELEKKWDEYNDEDEGVFVVLEKAQEKLDAINKELIRENLLKKQ